MMPQSQLPSEIAGGGDFFSFDSGGDSLSSFSGEGDTNLWLEITGVTNNLAYLTLHNTIEDHLYELLSKRALTDSVWTSEGVVLGAAAQTVTPTGVLTLDRTNSLFLRARNVTQDSDGLGLPDWWQMQYFGALGVDPYADPDNDGWSNIEEYERETTPTQFNTPPAPRGLNLVYDAPNSTVSVSWQKSPGPVIGYTVERTLPYGGATTNFSFLSDHTDFEDDFDSPTAPTYRVIAHYALGNSAWSQLATLYVPASSLSAQIVRGPAGRFFLAMPDFSPDVTGVRLRRERFGVPPTNEFAIEVSNFTNGIFEIPQAWLPPLGSFTWWWYVQTLSSNRPPSDSRLAGFAQLPFFDGTDQIRDNLLFLLKAAMPAWPFYYEDWDNQEFLGSKFRLRVCRVL